MIRQLAPAFALLMLCSSMAWAQREPSPEEQLARDIRVLAEVDGQPIYAYEVDNLLHRTLGPRELSAAQQEMVRNKALDQLIDQRLLVAFAQQRPHLLSEADRTRAWRQMQDELANRDTTVGQFLEQTGRQEPELRHAVEYPLAWQALLKHYATEENLQRYFERHRRQFDGTRLRVAHIFLELPEGATAEAIFSTRQYADELRQRIASGAIGFAEAARNISQAPSASEGGEIGWIEWQGPMPAAFTEAAFALKVNEVSKPIVTPLGVHLAKVLEEKPGTRELSDARPAVEQAVHAYLFRWAADTQRKASRVERLP